MSTATRTETCRQERLGTKACPVKSRTPIPAPQQEYHFEVSGEFPIFGRWREPAVHIAAPGNERQLAFWLAANESAGGPEALWANCIKSNPGVFSKLRPMELFDSSLDLPRGTVVLRSIEAPQWIKDDPPGEILDRLAAVRNRYPTAKVWLHEPVFLRPSENEAPVLLTTRLLQLQAARARQVVWSRYRRDRFRLKAEFLGRSIWQWLRSGWGQYGQRLEIRRRAMELQSSYWLSGQRDDVEEYISRARELGMHGEAEFMRIAAYGPVGMSPDELAHAGEFRDSTSRWPSVLGSLELVRESAWAADGLTALAIVAVPIALLTIPGLLVIDPILTYTLPEDENRHWFIGHWDWKQSPEGTKTLVYV